MTERAFEFGYRLPDCERWFTGFVRASVQGEAIVAIQQVATSYGMAETFLRCSVPDVCLPCNAEFFG